MRPFIFILLSGFINLCAQTSLPLVKGAVSNSLSGDKIPNCSIIIDDGRFSTLSDSTGRYSLHIPEGKHSIVFRRIGFIPSAKTILLQNAKDELLLNVRLDQHDIQSTEVTIRGDREAPAIITQRLEIKDLEKMPNIYSDVLRGVQILSGVSTSNELSSGYNVRGGTFDENLIYLNGYEIYRPVLLRQGTEENQSIVNPDLVSDLKFSNGAFSARYGDKMSSALEVNYISDDYEGVRGSIRADMMNMGAAVTYGSGKFTSSLGVRYAYPGLFLNRLQTKGDYKPSFSDIQYFGKFRPDSSNSFELFLLNSSNKYDVTPGNWIGNFRIATANEDAGEVSLDPSAGLASQIELKYTGQKYYKSYTGLYAIKYRHSFTNHSGFEISADNFRSTETENSDLGTDVYYSPDAQSPGSNREYLGNRQEVTDNKMTLDSYRVQGAAEMETGFASFRLGGEIKYCELRDKKYEYLLETGKYSLQDEPSVSKGDNTYYLSSSALYFQSKISLSPALQLEMGIRTLSYRYTEEFIFSPRAGITYFAGPKHTFSFRWGYYYQPPFFNEFNAINTDTRKLKSQRSVHYVLGWEWLCREGLSFQAQTYYKKLDRLIPFYYEDLKMVYTGTNGNNGYAFGVDLMLKGKILKTTDSWFGYSYLDTRERKNGTTLWKRRLMDQTHTLQIFLQDKMPKHPNWQSHLRFLAGSGFLNYDKVVITDPATGRQELKVNMDKPDEYLLYLRVDMGLSVTFNFGEKNRLVAIAEVLNVFDKHNYAGYEYLMVFPDIKGIVRVPKNLSPRFFNIKFQFTF